MIQATEIVDRVHRIGAAFELTQTGFRVKCAPGSMPAELISDLHQYKPQVRAVLAKDAYRADFPNPERRQEELAEMARRVEAEGYVLLWCEELEDMVAFYHNETNREKIPPGFVAYSDVELLHLFGPQQPGISTSTLRLIHVAKKKGARVTGSFGDTDHYSA